MDEQTLVSKIEKVLSMTASNFEEEVSTAVAKAQSIIQRYNLEHGTRLTLEEVQRKTDFGSDEYIMIDGSLGGQRRWRKALIFTLSKHMFCKAFTMPHGKYTLIGKETNIRACITMYDYIIPQMQRLASIAYYSRKIIADKKWMQAFYLGIVARINDRMVEIENQFKAESNNTMALMVLSDKELDEAAKKFVPKSRTIRMPSVDQHNYELGYSVGDNIAIHREIE